MALFSDVLGIPTPYLLIRLLFKFVLKVSPNLIKIAHMNASLNFHKVFYSSIVIENLHRVPPDGVPW